MKIEIDDELEDRVAEVRENGVRKGIYLVGTTPEAVVAELIRKDREESYGGLWRRR